MKGFFQAPWRFAACYAAFLIAAFTWALLDTFVIPHRELIVSRARDVADEVLETLVPSATLAAPQAAGASFYQDESMSVQLTTLRRDGTTCYVADVRLASPALLRTALAENTFGRNVTDTVSELAAANGAVLAINGDFYGSRKSGWCLRNGVLYRGTSASSPTELLLVDASGDFSIADDRTMTAGDAEGLWQISSLSKKLACGDLFRQNAFPLRFQRGRGNAQGNLAAQGSRIHRTCRWIRISLGGLRPSEPP